MKSISTFLFFAVVLSAYLLMSWQISSVDLHFSQILPAVQASIIQSLLSAFGSVFLGAIMVIGALSVQSPAVQRTLEILFLLPNLIPQLFVVISILTLAHLLHFTTGLFSVVFAHVLLNSGLVALSLKQRLVARLGGALDLAVVEGASARMIWTELLLPLLRVEISQLFAFVFSVCMMSFSIPLVLGGAGPQNLEVGIYQTLRMEGNWSQGLFLSLIQIVVVFLVGVRLPQSEWSGSGLRSRWEKIGTKFLFPICFLPAILIFFGWLMSFEKLAVLPVDEWRTWFSAMLNTFIVAIMTGQIVLLFTLWLSWNWPQRSLQFFLRTFIAPSSVIVAFSLVLVPVIGASFKMAIAMALISFPLLYRWIGHATLSSLSGQIEVARSLGATQLELLTQIIWPQSARSFFKMAAMAALWSSGDFAVASILGDSFQTWAMKVSDLMGNYRLDLAQQMSLPLAVVGLVTYFFFERIGRYVAG